MDNLPSEEARSYGSDVSLVPEHDDDEHTDPAICFCGGCPDAVRVKALCEANRIVQMQIIVNPKDTDIAVFIFIEGEKGPPWFARGSTHLEAIEAALARREVVRG